VRNRRIALLLAGVSVWACGAAGLAQGDKPAASAAPYSSRDLTGTWMGGRIGGTVNPGEMVMTPWAQAKFDAFTKLGDARAKNDPRRDCFPLGMPRNMYEPVPIEILQTPEQIVILMENDHFVRHIALDKAEHTKDVNPSWMGDSIGHWEGDTLVVDTVALRGETFLDFVGHPHSPNMHLIERFKRTDPNTLDDETTVDDPKAYVKPFVIQKVYKLKPGWHVMEHVCEDEWTEKLKKYYPDGYFDGVQ